MPSMFLCSCLVVLYLVGWDVDATLEDTNASESPTSATGASVSADELLKNPPVVVRRIAREPTDATATMDEPETTTEPVGLNAGNANENESPNDVVKRDAQKMAADDDANIRELLMATPETPMPTLSTRAKRRVVGKGSHKNGKKAG